MLSHIKSTVAIGAFAAIVLGGTWLLGCSNTYGYELLAAGELESFKDGKSRGSVIHAYYKHK